MEGKFVVPGDALGSADDYAVGLGVYRSSDGGIIRAALVGRVVVDQISFSDKDSGSTSRNPRVINVVNKNTIALDDLVLNVGDKVLCRVVRINVYQAYVDILTVGDQVLHYTAKGLIRREDIRSKEVDQVVVKDFFRGGDIVRAIVISLGDNKHYFLSTSITGDTHSDLGVVLRPEAVDAAWHGRC